MDCMEEILEDLKSRIVDIGNCHPLTLAWWRTKMRETLTLAAIEFDDVSPKVTCSIPSSPSKTETSPNQVDGHCFNLHNCCVNPLTHRLCRAFTHSSSATKCSCLLHALMTWEKWWRSVSLVTTPTKYPSLERLMYVTSELRRIASCLRWRMYCAMHCAISFELPLYQRHV